MYRLTAPFQLTTSHRQAIFYGLMYVGTGASLPFMPVWFADHGLSPAEIGTVLSVPLLLRALTGPISGLWADRFERLRTPLIWLGILGAAVYAGLAPGEAWGGLRFAAYLLFWTVGYSLVTSIGPLADMMTVTLSRREGFAYAVPRAFGSFIFVVSNVAIGYGLQWAGSDIVLWCAIAAAAASGAAALWILPAAPRRLPGMPEPVSRPALARVAGLFRQPAFVGLLISIGCLQAAHSFYYAFSTLIWRSQGISASLCGWLWAVGVLAEILFMGWGERLRRRLGPWRLLVIGGAASVFRWSMLAFAPSVEWLWPLQILHAMSFAAVYLAGLELVRKVTPEGEEGLGQTINSAYAIGLMMGVFTLLSGPLYHAVGAGGYAVMAGLSGVGLGAGLWLYTHRFTPKGQARADEGSSR